MHAPSSSEARLFGCEILLQGSQPQCNLVTQATPYPGELLSFVLSLYSPAVKRKKKGITVCVISLHVHVTAFVCASGACVSMLHLSI